MCALEATCARMRLERDRYEFVYFSEPDLAVRAERVAVVAAMEKIRDEAAQFQRQVYFPPVRTVSRSCNDPVNDTRLVVENACSPTAADAFPDARRGACTVKELIDAMPVKKYYGNGRGSVGMGRPSPS